MGLFDDILKKPQEKVPTDPFASGSGNNGTSSGGSTGSSGGQPPKDDSTGSTPMLIEKTAETSLFDTVKPMEQSVSSRASVLDTPNIHAEENTISLLGPTDTLPSGSILSTPLIVDESAPMSTDSLFTQISVAPSIPDIALSPLIDTPVLDTSTANDSIFSFAQEEEKVITPLFGTTETPSVVEKKKSEKMIHPKEFIERSIESIDSMIADIEIAYDGKVSEAKSYAQEKDRFATLEKDTYLEADTMGEEKTHALHVRKLLEKELTINKKKETPEYNESKTEKQEITETLPQDTTLSSPSTETVSIEDTLSELAGNSLTPPSEGVPHTSSTDQEDETVTDTKKEISAALSV